MTAMAKLTLNGDEYEFPVIVGTENEMGIDLTTLRSRTGAIALDPGYGNTGSCLSTITFIDGEKGILRYRGYPIEEIAASASFEEVCYLLIYGHLPTRGRALVFGRSSPSPHDDPGGDEGLLQGLPDDRASDDGPVGHAGVALGLLPIGQRGRRGRPQHHPSPAKAKTIAAFSYKKSVGQPWSTRATTSPTRRTSCT